MAYCQIQYDGDLDTPETVVQVMGHNAAYGANCPDRPCVIDQVKVEELKRPSDDGL